MKTFNCKGKSETSQKIVDFKVEAKTLAEATYKAKEECFRRDLKLIDIKEERPYSPNPQS